MRIALAQLNYHIGDFGFNVGRITGAIEQAKSKKADLIVFAELSVSGYPPRDFLEFEDFTRQCRQAVETIAGHCQGIAAIVGAPSPNPASKGKPLYNSAWFLADGRIVTQIHKSLLPNYDVFDEYRYFEPNRLPFAVIPFLDHNLAVTICEDLWNISDDPLYIRNPMDELIRLNPDLIINIAASPFHYSQQEARLKILSKNAVTYGLPLVYVNQVGGQTELIFDGGSLVLDPDGNPLATLAYFKEEVHIVDVSLSREKARKKRTDQTINPIGERLQRPQSLPDGPEIIYRIHDALILGIRDYFRKMGFEKAILGLSGGIDSAVTLVLAVRALGAANVRAVLLPSPYSSEHSITDAKQLAGNLGVPYDIIPIKEPYHAISETMAPLFAGLPFDLAEENIQARLRAVILMALSNKFGYILLNTSNKSEAAVGYGTLYGDMCGGLSVLGDVYKTQIYSLAGYINSQHEIIPVNTIIKPPSAELRPGQKDSDSLPEYGILDNVLYQYIEQRQGPDELIAAGFDPALVRRILKMVNTSEYKRHQTPPILRVSPKAFGMGRRMPIVAKYLS